MPARFGSLLATIDTPIFRSSSTDFQIEAYMRTMASALFGVLATVGGVPIIRALPGGPAQMVAEQLSKVCVCVFMRELFISIDM